MKKYLSTLALLAVTSIAMAASSTYTFESDAGTAENPLDFWTALNPDNGYTSIGGNNPYNVFCDNITYSSGSNAVYLQITDNSSTNYPLASSKNSGVHFKLSGVNLYVNGADALLSGRVGESGSGSITLTNGATLTVDNGGKVGILTSGTVHPASVENFVMTDNSATTVIVQNGSTLYNRNTQIGNTASDYVQLVKVIGSNNDVYFRNLSFKAAEGANADNAAGGVIEWVADANGISTIKHNGGTKAFEGILSFDFTNLVWDDAWGDAKTFTLLSSTDSTDAYANWVEAQEDLSESSNMAIFNGVEKGLFSYDNTHIYLTIEKADLIIPEPSTYAMIFGALALAFVAYKRRK